MGGRTLVALVLLVCGRPAPVHVWPHRGIAVPTNARVVLTAPAAWRGDATLSLVTAPSPAQPRTATKTSLVEWKTGPVARMELTPTGPLLPSTTYEVQTSRGEVIGVFTTSVLKDETKPRWRGIRGGRVTTTSKAECGTELIHLDGEAAATDDQTGSRDIRYAVWLASGPGKTPSYADPPLTWTTVDAFQQNFALTYGSTDPDQTDFELPKERPLRLGVKAIDLAGNASEASEVTLQ